MLSYFLDLFIDLIRAFGQYEIFIIPLGIVVVSILFSFFRRLLHI